MGSSEQMRGIVKRITHFLPLYFIVFSGSCKGRLSWVSGEITERVRGLGLAAADDGDDFEPIGLLHHGAFPKLAVQYFAIIFDGQ
jgi:hypothetical protein